MIHYNHTAPLPSSAATLSSFYAAAGYQIATSIASVSKSFSTAASATATSSTVTASTATFSTSNATSQAITPASSTLRLGTRAGIGVGTAVGIFATGTLFSFFLCRWRRSRRPSHANDTPVELANNKSHCEARYEEPELNGDHSRTELDVTERKRSELAGEDGRLEMEAEPLKGDEIQVSG